MRHFIIIDDDPTNNMICILCIKMVFADAEVTTFTDPRAGLAYVDEEFSRDDSPEAVLFLDINMPYLTGWDFLSQFDTLSETHKKKITIYMLSSSIDQRDISRANENPHVIQFLSKPLNKQKVSDLLVTSDDV